MFYITITTFYLVHNNFPNVIIRIPGAILFVIRNKKNGLEIS